MLHHMDFQHWHECFSPNEFFLHALACLWVQVLCYRAVWLL